MALSLLQDISLSTIFAGFKRVESWWNFKNVISPFYRLYYIESGYGKVFINNIPYELAPGQLFLIPKFSFHTYECDNYMDHYYICFFDDLTNSLGIPYPEKMNRQVWAQPNDLELIRRYTELNCDKGLTTVNPQQYNKTIYKQRETLTKTAQIIESQGILLQLFSRFISEDSVSVICNNNSYDKLTTVVKYINQNLDKQITIPYLAEFTYLTPDHFSRIFSKVLGMTPCKYIQMKRIERSQALLLTSNMSIIQVAEKVGIYNSAQFTRLFIKIAKCTPSEYRSLQFNRIDMHK